MFNEVLLEEGYAQLYIVSPNDRYESRFEQAQQQARSAGRGLWGLPRDQLCQLTDRGNGIGEGSPGCEGANSPGGSPPGAAVADKTCTDFPSRVAAQREYERDRSDPHNLDADGDGEA